MQKNIKEPKEQRILPRLGQRIVKTSLAVFICLIIYYIVGLTGADMPAEAALTAIICMQPFVSDTEQYALNRVIGTLIGAVWGLLFLLILSDFPVLCRFMPVVYALMCIGVTLSLYTSVAIRMPDTSGLAAIVFVCVVIAYPDIDEPLLQALRRLEGIAVGTFSAILVNVVRLPRSKHPERVIFVRVKDLVPDRFSRISPAVLFRLNNLYKDGAKICLITEHAPAFSSIQMNDAMLKIPMIVMDGAAVYDLSNNSYLSFEPIPAEASKALKKKLDELSVSEFIYTIHKDRTCIFHRGELRAPEKLVYERMRSSPYRSYLEGELYEPEEIVYFKINAVDEEIKRIAFELREFIPEHGLRAVLRPQTQMSGVSGLYIYSEKATVGSAIDFLMDYLGREEEGLEKVEIQPKRSYKSEHDALVLMNRIGNVYEPVKFFGRNNSKKTERK